MTDVPRYGQRAPEARQEMCPKHPGVPAVAYCKRCNRPACADCAIPTEVGSICTDCAGPAGSRRAAFSARPGGSPWGRPGARRVPAMASRPPAPVTSVLIGINVVMFVLQQIFHQVTDWLAFNPILAYSQPWRLLTSAFLHADFWHILFNMLMLYMIGSSIERAIGKWRYLTVYLLSALGGSMAIIAWVLVQPQSAMSWTIGASGAVYGLLGSVLVLQKRAGMSTTSILVLLGVNLFYSFMNPGVSWQGHIGGFLVGLITTAIFVWSADRSRSKGQKAMDTYSILSAVILTLVLLAGTWGLYVALGA